MCIFPLLPILQVGCKVVYWKDQPVKIRVLLILSFFVILSAVISSTLFSVFASIPITRNSVCAEVQHETRYFSLISNTRHSISSDIKHETQVFPRISKTSHNCFTDIKHARYAVSSVIQTAITGLKSRGAVEIF